MIYRFVIISNEVKDFRRDIRISGASTFAELHSAIVEALGYDAGEPSLFRITNNRWEPQSDVYLYDMGFSNSDEDTRLMKDTYLDEYLDSEKQHLLFTFDMMGNRSLYIELREITLGENIDAPEVVRSSGEPPVQTTSIEEFLTASAPASTEDPGDSDDYGFSAEGGYNEEDLENLDVTTEDEL